MATSPSFWAGPLLLAFFRMHSDLASSSRFSWHGVLCRRECVLDSMTGLTEIDSHLVHFVRGFPRGLSNHDNLHRCHFPARRNSMSNHQTPNCFPLQAEVCGRCNILLNFFYPVPHCLQHLQSILYVVLALRPQYGLWRYCHSRLSISVCLKYGQWNGFLVGRLGIATEYESWMLYLRVPA